MSDGWGTCPRCGSKRVQQQGKVFFFLFMFGMAGVLFWVGLLFWPFMIAAIFLAIISPVSFFLQKMNQCKDCNKTWKAAKH